MIQDKNTQPAPWYRQFWFWFLMMPLFASFIAGGILVSTAVRHSDDLVIDNYYREGRGINQVFEQDQRARDLGLTAALQFDREVGEVLLQLPPVDELPDTLKLLMDHPVSARRDQQIVLVRTRPGHYRGELEQEPRHRWYLSLVPGLDGDLRARAEWRLRGEIDFAQAEAIVLEPLVGYR